MDRDCARTARFTPTRLIGTFLVALVCVGVAWITYAIEVNNQKLPPAAQASAVAAAVDDPFENVSLNAKAAYVVDTDGRVRYASNENAQLPLASLTKIALVMAVSEVLNPDDIIALTRPVSGNGKGDTLPQGSEWRVRDLIDFTIVASSNDGAEVLAEQADEALRAKYPEAPKGGAALWRMNALAKDLKLQNTYYTNVTGLDESPTQSGSYGSARDIATLVMYAVMNHEEVFRATKQETLQITSTKGLVANAKNTDDALPNIVGFLMGKTGLTDLAGGNLAVAFDARGRRYAAVVLGSTEKGRFDDISKIASILVKNK